MRLTDASLHPIALTIETQAITAYKLTLGDLEGISQGIAQQQRDAAENQEARDAIEPMTPGQLLPWLLTTARGQALTLFTAIQKNHPEIGMDRICSLTWNDDLVQTVYDLLEVKRSDTRAKSEGENSADPPISGQDGEPILPISPTSTPDSTGESSRTGS